MEIDETRVELLRDFGSPIEVVEPTVYEIAVALDRGLKDPREFLDMEDINRRNEHGTQPVIVSES